MSQERPLTRSVDDLDIEHASAFKQLASWGGFRRHFREEEYKDDKSVPGPSVKPRTVLEQVEVPTIEGDSLEWKRKLQEQLLAKRAEVLATQRKLESLNLEQRELELLVTRTL